jgi:hypothetical protein
MHSVAYSTVAQHYITTVVVLQTEQSHIHMNTESAHSRHNSYLSGFLQIFRRHCITELILKVALNTRISYL